MMTERSLATHDLQSVCFEILAAPGYLGRQTSNGDTEV